MKFEDISIRPEIIQGLKEHNIVEPTQIQANIIPKIMSGKDVIGISKTGSGKTLAFMAPILNNIDDSPGIKALVIVPTRELAEQIKNEIFKFGKYTKQKVTAIYGGVSINPQFTALKYADIVIGTPGRLCDHIQRNSINLRDLKYLVLDEADRMVSMGFIDDVETILRAAPQKKQTMLFGATLGEEILRLKERYMTNPETIGKVQQVSHEYLDQFYHLVDEREKFSLLVHLLKKEEPTLGIVFCSTRATTDIVSRNLKMQGVNSEAIHGGLTQNKRLQVIDNFHKGKTVILVATDIAARGLDIKNVSHVINYSLPKNPEDYVHRIGRTARADSQGKAITLLSPSDYDAMRAIEGRYPIKVQQAEKQEFAKVDFIARSNNHGRSSYGGQRRSFDNGPRRFGNDSRRPSNDGQRRFGSDNRRPFNSNDGQRRFGGSNDSRGPSNDGQRRFGSSNDSRKPFNSNDGQRRGNRRFSKPRFSDRNRHNAG